MIERVIIMAKYITVKELSALLRQSRASTFTQLRNGRFGPEPLRISRSLLFDCGEVQRWLDCGAPNKMKWQALKRELLAKEKNGLIESRIRREADAPRENAQLVK
jgi:predicted DNA-binding transcriptional regulator AlpA